MVVRRIWSLLKYQFCAVLIRFWSFLDATKDGFIKVMPDKSDVSMCAAHVCSYWWTELLDETCRVNRVWLLMLTGCTWKKMWRAPNWSISVHFWRTKCISLTLTDLLSDGKDANKAEAVKYCNTGRSKTSQNKISTVLRKIPAVHPWEVSCEFPAEASQTLWKNMKQRSDLMAVKL